MGWIQPRQDRRLNMCLLEFSPLFRSLYSRNAAAVRRLCEDLSDQEQQSTAGWSEATLPCSSQGFPSAELSYLASVGKHTPCRILPARFDWTDECRATVFTPDEPLSVTQKNNKTKGREICAVSSHQSLKHPTNISFTLFVWRRRCATVYTIHGTYITRC